VVASFAGVYLSFFIDSAPAPTIVLLMAGTFIAAFVRQHGFTSRRSARAAE
jgi:manganese/iron transport system permease protein